MSKPSLLSQFERRGDLEKIAKLEAKVVELTKALAVDNLGYCPTCTSCGETGCCAPTSCEFVRCHYGPSNLKDYKQLSEEHELMYAALEEMGVDMNNFFPVSK